jgi:predicted amidohydrolase YtcJ
MPELFPTFLPQISRQRLDELAPDNPVRVKNSWVDGLVNTRALEEIARIFPEQEIEGRGNRGPTGRQLEPDIMLYNKVELNAELLKAQMELWAAHGVTVYGSSPYTIGNLNALRILDEEGRMPGRFAWSYTGPDLHAATVRPCPRRTGSKPRKTAGSSRATMGAASRRISCAAAVALPPCTRAATRTSITCSTLLRRKVKKPGCHSRRSVSGVMRSITPRALRDPTRYPGSRTSA